MRPASWSGALCFVWAGVRPRLSFLFCLRCGNGFHPDTITGPSQVYNKSLAVYLASMPRIRTIKPEIIEDERTAALSDQAFRLLVSCVTLADDHGCLRSGPGFLESRIYWATTSKRPISKAMAELEMAGLIQTYNVGGQSYAHVIGWTDPTSPMGQRITDPGKRRIPEPPSINPENAKVSDGPEIATESNQELTSNPEQFLVGNSRNSENLEVSRPDLGPRIRDLGSRINKMSTSAEADLVFFHYRKFHPRWRSESKMKSRVVKILTSGYTAEDLCLAIDGNHRSPFHCGENENKQKHHGLGLILRDSDHISKFIDLAKPQRKSRAHETFEAPPQWSGVSMDEAMTPEEKEATYAKLARPKLVR